MVYNKLLLNAGGGIISTLQQAEAADNTASLFIGLGGTGVDAIRHIKTQVYRRLRPDNPDAAIPEYQHIRFLGVDTDNKSPGSGNTSNTEDAGELLSLAETEFLNIQNSNFGSILGSPQAMDQRPEFNWVRSRNDLPKVDLSQPGAGGVRMLGRMLLVDKSDAFLNKVQTELNTARSNLKTPKINIHVFTGLSGGTGGGNFLDACYLIKKATSAIQGQVSVFGYFFLPDVNLAKIAFEASATRSYIEVNGYAALQELDYCMNLPENSGSFYQTYQNGNVVSWSEPPVKLAHLISATDANNNVIPNAYEHAMNVTSEYVLELLTKQLPLNGTVFDMAEHYSNFDNQVRTSESNKTVGRAINYVVIGASCATVPIREVNTYLVSKIFEKFPADLKMKAPEERVVKRLTTKALTDRTDETLDVSGIVDILYDRLGGHIAFTTYHQDWKYVRDNGNADLDKYYHDILAKNQGDVETNVKHFTSGHARIGSLESNKESLLAKLVSVLDACLTSTAYGPVYVSSAISGSQGTNIINVLEGLKEETEVKLSYALGQYPQRVKEHNDSLRAFNDAKNSLTATLKANKLYKSYLIYVASLKAADLEIYKLGQLQGVLEELIKQVRELNQKYYQKLSQVLINVIDSFALNFSHLNAQGRLTTKLSYELPMMTINELKPTMDDFIDGQNEEDVFSGFITHLIDEGPSKAWLAEDERQTCKVINDYFINNFLGVYSDKTIEHFLQEKYDTTDPADLQNHVYKDFMQPLEAKAEPLFPYNNQIWDRSRTNEVKYLSIPGLSTSITAAAQQFNGNSGQAWQVKTTGLTDRIYMMRSACVLPLAAYGKLNDYADTYYKSPSTGVHYYEGVNYKGEPIEGMDFSDWRKLAPLLPSSLVDLTKPTYHANMREQIRQALDLYRRSKAYGLIDASGQLLEPTNLSELHDDLDKLQADLASPSIDRATLKKISTDLEATKGACSFMLTGLKLQSNGNQNKLSTLHEDYFVASPALHSPLRQAVEALDELTEKQGKVEALLKEKRHQVEVVGQAKEDFAKALFTGVLKVEKFKVSYVKTELEISEEKVLSDLDFPYGVIPPYQAFLNYLDLEEVLREGIRTESQERLKEASLLSQQAAIISEYLSERKIGAWLSAVRGEEHEGEVIDFIKGLKRAFELHCNLYID